MSPLTRFRSARLRIRLSVWVLLSALALSVVLAVILDSPLAGALGGGLFAVTGWLFSHFAIRPLADVVEMAGQIVHGERKKAFPQPSGNGEVADLTTALNQLIASRTRESSDFYATGAEFLGTFENAAVGIAHVGLDYRWLRVNTKMCELVGYPREELFTKTFIDITHPDDVEADLDCVRAMLAGKIPSYSLEKRYVRKDGGVIWTNLTVSLARDAAGQPACFISVIEDISERKHVEEGLLKNAELLRMATLVGRIYAFEWDVMTDEVIHSTDLAELLGLKAKTPQLTAQELFTMVLPEDLPGFQKALFGLTPAADTYVVTLRVVRPDHRIVTFEERARGFFDDQGRLVRVIGMAADITDREQAEAALRRSETRLRAILDSAHVAVQGYDRNGRVIFWNKGAEAFFGCSADEAIGKTLDQLLIFDESGAREFVATLEQIDRTGEPSGPKEWIIHTPADEKKIAYSMIYAIPGLKEGNEFVSLDVDITPLKRAEAELSAAKEAAEAANRAKDDFLASLSHELRTPLNPVLMLASEMAENEEIPAKVREDFSLIRKNVALEARLIDDLLDITRIARGKIQIDRHRIDAHDVMNQALAVIQADLTQKRIALSVEFAASDSWLMADPVRLQQIFWNVLSNATKFTPSGGRIIVRSRNLPDERTLVFEINDTGIGLTPDEISRAFTAFDQGDHAGRPGTQRLFGGLGLGLTICRELLTIHGGQIRAYSAGRGQGATFVIELPLAPKERTSSRPSPLAESTKTTSDGSKHLHILLVEDHEPTRTILNRLLRRHGYEVECADSLATARKLAAQLATPQGDPGFDLLLSDLALPDGTGHELMSELRGHYGARLRGIALSGFGSEKDVERSLACGFSSHLTKPVDIQALQRAMER